MTIKLCTCMFLGLYQKLIGVKICNEVNNPEDYNQTSLHSLDLPITFLDLPMFLGISRFCALWISFFEVRVLPWQSLLKQGHGKGPGEAVQYHII